MRLHRNQPRLGWRRNFMTVLARCESDLIASCDQDECGTQQSSRSPKGPWTNRTPLLFFHDAWLIEGRGQRTGPANISLSRNTIHRCRSIHFSAHTGSRWCAIARCSRCRTCGINRLTATDRRNRAPHDQWLFFLATVLGTVRFSRERLTGYRQHVGNAVGPPVPRGVLPRLRRARQYWLGNPEARFRNLAKVARDRADILAACCNRLSDPWRQRAILGRDRYLELASHLESAQNCMEIAASARGRNVFGSCKGPAFIVAPAPGTSPEAR